MAVKDTEPYLPSCLDSVSVQTYQNWELIAVNDHSSDRSLEILQEYAAKDSRIKVFQSEGQKLIPALQKAYQNVSGTLINRMDSDDIMPPDKLEVLYSAWSMHGVGTVIAGGTKHFVDRGEVGDGFIKYENWLNAVARNGSHLEEIYQECVIPSHCWIIHKSDMDRVGAFNPDVYPEDYDLCFRFYKSNLKIIGIDKILHFWRDRSNRISRTWDCYKDNRYFDLKLRYFYEIDRIPDRPLVLWGGGKNGKDLAKLLLERENFHWVCDNPNKIGKEIYGITMGDCIGISKMKNPQILVVVTNPDEKKEIKKQLFNWGKKPVNDFWFFL